LELLLREVGVQVVVFDGDEPAGIEQAACDPDA
jgi:hypothetical protein